MYVKFSKAYVSKLEYPADGKEVLKEISNMSGVPLASSIDNLRPVSKFRSVGKKRKQRMMTKAMKSHKGIM